MTTDATVSPPTATAARRLSEQVHFLTDRTSREVLVGLATLEAAAGGYATPREGEIVRDLLGDALVRLFETDRPRYERAARAGRKALAERDRARAERAAGRA